MSSNVTGEREGDNEMVIQMGNIDHTVVSCGDPSLEERDERAKDKGYQFERGCASTASEAEEV